MEAKTAKSLYRIIQETVCITSRHFFLLKHCLVSEGCGFSVFGGRVGRVGGGGLVGWVGVGWSGLLVFLLAFFESSLYMPAQKGL